MPIGPLRQRGSLLYAPWVFRAPNPTNGSDLATALVVDYVPEFKMTLADAPALMGADVQTYGYPLTTVRPSPKHAGTINFALNDRFLQGYIMRVFHYEHTQYGRVVSYELDMPAPAGLSGAPLIEMGSTTVIGVIYGTNDVETIEQFSQVDSETGKRTPEVVRVTSFALAHHTETLRNLRGLATRELPLAEHLAT